MHIPLVGIFGSRLWTKNRTFHRIGGAAWIPNSSIKSYFQEGKRHRLNGPAIIWANGDKQYWRYGKCIV